MAVKLLLVSIIKSQLNRNRSGHRLFDAVRSRPSVSYGQSMKRVLTHQP